MTISRRNVLKTGGAIASATILGPACTVDEGSPVNGQTIGEGSGAPDPGAIPALKPVRGDGSHPYHYIENVVIVQMENRSFDHYFGSLSLVERKAVDGLQPGMMNPSSSGDVIDIAHLSDAYIIDPDPGHGHAASVRQFASGTNQGFVQDWERLLSAEEKLEKLFWPMGYYLREQLPTFYTLADNFTLCDRWFCSLLGPTWPNRFFSHAATSDGQVANDLPLESPTIYAPLLGAGHSVKVYHQGLVYFMLTVKVPAATTYPAEPLEQFFQDAENGTLPNVSIVEPDYFLNDDHPPRDARLGQAFVQGVYEALRKSPQWDRTLMLVFYDEHGGFHDHVVPPTIATDERAEFNQLGFRIPGLVIGPLVKRGHVFSETLEHSSVPALLSRIFDVPFSNERARQAGDFANALDLNLIEDARRPTPISLEAVEIPHDKIRAAANLPFSQPELAAYGKRAFNIDLGTPTDNLRRWDRYFERLERMKVARVRTT